jgi:hypothetical protein
MLHRVICFQISGVEKFTVGRNTLCEMGFVKLGCVVAGGFFAGSMTEWFDCLPLWTSSAL